MSVEGHCCRPQAPRLEYFDSQGSPQVVGRTQAARHTSFDPQGTTCWRMGQLVGGRRQPPRLLGLLVLTSKFALFAGPGAAAPRPCVQVCFVPQGNCLVCVGRVALPLLGCWGQWVLTPRGVGRQDRCRPQAAPPARFVLQGSFCVRAGGFAASTRHCREF